MKEYKLKIKENLQQLQRKFEELKARQIEEVNIHDTYYNQKDPNSILKVTVTDDGAYLVSLYNEHGSFKMVSRDLLPDPVATKKMLYEKFGIKGVVMKKQYSYIFEPNEINNFEESIEVIINIFDDIGTYMIVMSEKPPLEFLKVIGINNPVFVAKSFLELKHEN